MKPKTEAESKIKSIFILKDFRNYGFKDLPDQLTIKELKDLILKYKDTDVVYITMHNECDSVDDVGATLEIQYA